MNRVLIAVDDPEVRDRLAALVSADSRMDLVGAAGYAEAIPIAEGPNPADFVLLNPTSLTLEDLTEHRRPFRLAAAILVTGQHSDQLLELAAAARYEACFDLNTDLERLAFYTLLCGYHIWLNDKSADPSFVTFPRLTQQEVDVLRCIENGMTNKQAAEALGLSTRTVKQTVTSILRKLAVKNVVQAVIVAYRHGYLP